MCDYSLQSVKTRDAALHDDLVTRNFGTGTTGFASVGDPTTAVCVRPGTEIAFEKPIQVHGRLDSTHKTAIFRQINKLHERMHHDCLELPDGEELLLTYLAEGQKARILQLPAAPQTKQEALDQERLVYSGH